MFFLSTFYRFLSPRVTPSIPYFGANTPFLGLSHALEPLLFQPLFSLEFHFFRLIWFRTLQFSRLTPSISTIFHRYNFTSLLYSSVQSSISSIEKAPLRELHDPGDMLFSRWHASLSSPWTCLTAVFGMGTGVTPLPSSPDRVIVVILIDFLYLILYLPLILVITSGSISIYTTE